MIDLHVHSSASDGSFTPAEVVELAKNAGITQFALTDHDTVAGVAEALAHAQEIGDIIDNLLSDSEQTVKVMDEVNVIVNEQRNKLEETKQKFNMVTDGVDTTRNEAEVIRGQANNCDSARTKIVDIIQDLSAISEENAASTQQTNASMQELNATLQILADSAKSLLELSEKLEQDVAFFKL